MKIRIARLVCIAAGALFLAVPIAGWAQEEPSCEDLRCALQEQLNADCTCGAADNHGSHVSCVAHAVNALARAGDIPNNCKGKLTRCAARSTCGKAGRTTCLIPTYGTCVDGLCAHDGETVCTVDTECVTSVRCKIASSDERCVEHGGSPNGPGTCCSACGVPPPL